MFTLLAYDSSIAVGSVLVPCASILDQHVRQNGNGYIVPGLSKLAGAFAFGSNISRAQLQSPTLRKTFNEELRPLATAMAGVDQVPPGSFNFGEVIDLTPGEELDAQVIQGGGVAENDIVAAFLSDGPLKPVDGKIFTVRVTATVTLTANAWSLAQLTFDQQLQPAHYQVVGARFNSTGIVLFRFSFVGGVWRPGHLGSRSVAAVDPPGSRAGAMGVWGEFDSIQPPSVEFLSTSADTSETGELDLILTGPIKGQA